MDLLLVVVFCGGKQKKLSKSLNEKGGMGRIKPIGKFFRERRGMTMGRRILAVLAALLPLLWAAVTPTHRSTVANILIYLAIALATAAVIALVGGSSNPAKPRGKKPGKNRDKRKNRKSRITTNSKAESHR